MDAPMIDLNEHRLDRVRSRDISRVVELLENVPAECFDINLDIIEFVDNCRNARLQVPNEDFTRRLCNEVRSRVCRHLISYLMLFNRFKAVIDVLMKHSHGLVQLCFHFKRHFNDAPNGEHHGEFNGNPDSDILAAERVMQVYITFQNTTDPTVCNAQLLKELAQQCMEKLRTMDDRAELQKEADLLVVVTRVRSQLCRDNGEVKTMIEEMWNSLPGCVNKYYASLVYQGRDIVSAAEQGDVRSVREYRKQLEKMCLRCKRISIMSMYHHRMVFVYRKLYQVTQTEEIKQLALRHCEYGFRYAQVLNTNFLIYFRKFFLMSEVLIRLGVNVDYTCFAFERVSTQDNIRKAEEKLNELSMGYVDKMVPEELLAYYFCKARIAEGDNIPRALEYMQEVLRLHNNGLTFPVNQLHVRSYHAHLDTMIGRQPMQPARMLLSC